MKFKTVIYTLRTFIYFCFIIIKYGYKSVMCKDTKPFNLKFRLHELSSPRPCTKVEVFHDALKTNTKKYYD
jgi:hypothetical protein